MDRRYQNYSRRIFNEWRNRVKMHLPAFVTAFYSTTSFIDYDKHKLLGNVISGINDPYYSIIGSYGSRLDNNSEMAMQIILKIQVNELFAFIKKVTE